MVVAFIAVSIYAAQFDAQLRTAVAAEGSLWLGLVALGGVLQAATWLRQATTGRLSLRALSFVTIGSLMTLIGIAALREIIRLSQLDRETVAANTQAAAAVGGFALFVVCTVITGLLMAWCIRLTRTAVTKDSTSEC